MSFKKKESTPVNENFLLQIDEALGIGVEGAVSKGPAKGATTGVAKDSKYGQEPSKRAKKKRNREIEADMDGGC